LLPRCAGTFFKGKARLKYYYALIKKEKNYWSQVFDFTPNIYGCPNWLLLDPSQYPGPHVKMIEEFPAPDSNPVEIPKIYGGDSDE
jgi:hypothetical protein